MSAQFRAVSLSAQSHQQSNSFLGSGLFFGRCALGKKQACFDLLLRGLVPDDRAYVHLESNQVVVDSFWKSNSANFQTLQKVACAIKSRTVIEILSPAQHLTIRQREEYPNGKIKSSILRMGSPKTDNGFDGYTFFQYRGVIESGIIYSAGDYTLVAVNQDQTLQSMIESIHHELRHVLLGDFGRASVNAKHGLPRVEEETSQAEKEADRNFQK